MVQFTKLRLSGFKSFVEATELLIEPGLTGIVGPNGCGKSNLVEALRWVMGETSAKQMRGSEMDDVIFGGTSNRPARNLAEVALAVDNGARTAPAAFNDYDELEISRRIERGAGSTYRVNGKEVRARDVQLLFADAATGARSAALVSQGRIGAIINARPADRRLLLEEAAGISGLHTRRHEAEIRLRGAEANLERLEDVLRTLDAQLQNLRKQARQAARYRDISEIIRRAEGTLLHLRWSRAMQALEEARERLKSAEVEVAQRTGATAEHSTRQAEAAAELPALRQAEAEAAAELQRLSIARDGLDAEEQRVAGQRRDVEARLQQVRADIAREEAMAADAAQAIRRLEEEREEIRLTREDEAALQAESAERLAEVRTVVEDLETRLAQLTQRIAEEEARRTALRQRTEELAQRRERLTQRLSETEVQRRLLAEDMVSEEALAEALERVQTAVEALEGARVDIEAAETARQEARGLEAQARDGLQAAQSEHTRLKAEEKALTELLAAGGGDGEWPPLIDAVAVESGLEAALGAALGEDLSAPVDEAAPVHWRTLPPLDPPPPLPEGAEPLSRFVRGPEALARRLSQIGVVADAEAGRKAQKTLAPGQRLVSRAGDLWRWDGFSVAASAPTAAAIRLRQRNRLAELREETAQAEERLAAAEERLAQARSAVTEAEAAEQQARTAAKAFEADLAAARDAQADLARKSAAASSRLATVDEAAERLRNDLAETESQLEEAEQAGRDMADPTTGREEMAAARAELAERRAALIEAQSAHDRLLRETAARQQRLEAITAELASWANRQASATGQRTALADREAAAVEELEELAQRPEEIAAKRAALFDMIGEAETRRRAAADRLAEAETRLAEADRALRTAEAALATAREERVRCEAAVEQCRQTCRTIAERTAERLECAPEKIRETVEIEPDDKLPDIETIEKRLERLLKERETMGPVNLRAEVEAAEMEEQLGVLETERADLVKAIEKLRHGIQELNREGRERLLASFAKVDESFRTLFTRLFGGGRAHLALTESDDPLEAGLEIMASPPGKRLQVLSLLSGGEQALTALALLFAVFLTNPAPICVLDEVDAPLDDANVDRFCTLVAEIARSCATRFLIITHHRMTMARVDRLFGVTMVERGVSQLVSVDLRAAEELRATA